MNLSSQAGFIRDATIQTLATQSAEFNLGHVEPTAMLGGVMELKAIRKAVGFLGFEGLVEGSRRVGIEIVENHDNDLCFRIIDIGQCQDRG